MSKPGTKFELPRTMERYLAALSKLYGQKGDAQRQKLIVNSKMRIHEEWSYDNWNGGTYGHALFFIVPESLYLELADMRDDVQVQLKDDINKLHNVQGEFIEEVFLEMEVSDEEDWRRESGVLLLDRRNVSPEAERRIWTGGQFRVFLSHKTEVKREAAELKDRLQLFGASAFVAHEDIHPTKAWQDEIENALSTMDAFVALLTEEFHDSLWTDQEVGYAFGRGVPIVAVKLGRDPYGFIGKFQALSCGLQEAPCELVKLFISHERMLNAYIDAVRKCKSFDAGNLLSQVLHSISGLSEQHVATLVSAFDDNLEVRGSFGFNGSRPNYYGPGLASHLSRITGRSYSIVDSHMVGKMR